jgi:hypothetical protein
MTSDPWSDRAAVIAFYGIDGSVEAMRSFYHQGIEIFETLGYPVEKMAVQGPGFSGNYTMFKRTHPKLQKVGFNAITAFELAVLLPNTWDPMVDFLIYTSCEVDKQIAYIAVNSSVSRLPSETMETIAQGAIQCLKPVYGIGYNREYKIGPTFYVRGAGYIGAPDVKMPISGPELEEEVRHGHWGRLGIQKHVYREGVIRDVYPWNFLTTPHLEARVGNCSLHDWIQQDAQRGHLKLLNQGVWLWEVAESNIPIIRPDLWDPDIIFKPTNYFNACDRTLP